MAYRDTFGVAGLVLMCITLKLTSDIWRGWNDMTIPQNIIYGLVTTVLVFLSCISLDIYRLTPEGVSYPVLHQLALYIFKRCLTSLSVRPAYRRFIKNTENCKKVQEAYLLEHLYKNKDTVYGRKYSYSKIRSREDYVTSVPLIKQADIAPYCARIAAGEHDILTAEAPCMMALTTGTTGNNCPIPVVASAVRQGIRDLQAVTWKVLLDFNNQETPLRKELMLMFVSKMGETEGGLTLGPLSLFFMRPVGKLMNAMTPVPFTLLQEMTSRKELTYLAMLLALADRTLSSVSTTFAITLLSAMRLVEENWQRMVQEIRTGQIQITEFTADHEIIAKVGTYLKADPVRADELETEFSRGFVGIIRRIWPSIRVVGALTTGSMALYGEELKRGYAAGVVIYSGMYGSTEGYGGVNLDPRADPVTYVFMPNASFYEFIREDDMDQDQPDTLFAEQVEIGETYELVLTNMNGLCRYRFGDVVRITDFFNATPVFSYQYRKGQLLNIVNEKTTEVSVFETVRKTVDRWRGCSLHDYTCALSIMTENISGYTVLPGSYYVFFLELRYSDGSTRVITDDEKLLMDTTLRSISQMYDIGRRKGLIGPIRVHIVHPGTFVDLREYILHVTTASAVQFKMPRVLKRDLLVKFMIDRIV